MDIKCGATYSRILHCIINVVSLLTRALSLCIAAETIQKVRSLKKSAHLVLMNSLEKAIWNWMDTYPNEFAEVQKQPNEDLGKACEELFHVLDAFVDNKKSRAAVVVWPLQIMLLVLLPKVLEEIVRSDKGTGSPRHIKKRHFIDNVKRGLGMYGSSSSRQLTEAAAVTCVKLTKAATYISNQHSNNVVLTLVQQLMADLMSLLFSTSKPFSRGQNYTAQDVDLIIDCFISCFRINPHNSEVLKVCLNVNYPSTYQFVLVSSLYKQVPKTFCSLGSLASPHRRYSDRYLMHAFQNHHAAEIVVVAADRSSLPAQHETPEHVHRHAQQGHAELHMVRAVAHDP